MKLAQNQIWRVGDEYLRIVHLERLEVRYKALKDLAAIEGKHHVVSKKEFCRLLKGATLLDESQARELRMQHSMTNAPAAEVTQKDGGTAAADIPES